MYTGTETEKKKKKKTVEKWIRVLLAMLRSYFGESMPFARALPFSLVRAKLYPVSPHNSTVGINHDDRALQQSTRANAENIIYFSRQ